MSKRSGIAHDTRYYFSTETVESSPSGNKSLDEAMELTLADISILNRAINSYNIISEKKYEYFKNTGFTFNDFINEDIRYYLQQDSFPNFIKKELEIFIHQMDEVKSNFYQVINKILENISGDVVYERMDEIKKLSVLISVKSKIINITKDIKQVSELPEKIFKKLVGFIFLYLHHRYMDKDGLLEQPFYQDFMQSWMSLQVVNEKLNDYLQLSTVQYRYLKYFFGIHFEVLDVTAGNVEETAALEQAIIRCDQDISQASAILYKNNSEGWRLHFKRKTYTLDIPFTATLTKEELLESPGILAHLKSELIALGDNRLVKQLAQLSPLVAQNSLGGLYAVPSVLDALALIKNYKTLIIWRQTSKTKLRPIHYLSHKKQSTDSECHLLLYYPIKKIILKVNSKESKYEKKDYADEKLNKHALYIYLEETKIPTATVYFQGRMYYQFVENSYHQLIRTLQILQIPLPNAKLAEICLIHPQYIYEVASLCKIPAKYRLLNLETYELIARSPFNSILLPSGLEDCDIAIIQDMKYFESKDEIEKNIVRKVKCTPELHELPLVILFSEQVALYGKTLAGKWQLQLAPNLEPQLFANFISNKNPSDNKDYVIIPSEEVPIEVFEEIAKQEAHIPFDNYILYDVTENLKHSKRERWQEGYFFLTVDAFHRAAHKASYLPWVKGLLGVNSPKYFNQHLNNRRSNLFTVVYDYNNFLIHELIEIVKELYKEEEPKIIEFAEEKWKLELEQTEQEIKKGKTLDTEGNLLFSKQILLNNFIKDLEKYRFLPKKTKLELLNQDCHYDSTDNSLSRSNSKESLGSRESSLVDLSINSEIFIDHISEEKTYVKTQNISATIFSEFLVSIREKAYGVWLEQNPKLLEQIFLRIYKQIRTRLVASIKSKIALKIEEEERQVITEIIRKDYRIEDEVEIKENLLEMIIKEKIQLLLRFSEILLLHQSFKDFSKDWKWGHLILNLYDNLGKIKLHEPFILEAKLNVNSNEKCLKYQAELIYFLHKYLSRDKALYKILRSQYESDHQQWVFDFARQLLRSGIDKYHLNEATDPYSGNTLLHWALLLYSVYKSKPYLQQNMIMIIQYLFNHGACLSSLNHDHQNPLQFSQLVDRLGDRNEQLSNNYQLFYMSIKNIPIFSELSYLSLMTICQFLYDTWQALRKNRPNFKGLKEGQLQKVIIFLNEYITQALYTQNDQRLEEALTKLYSDKELWQGVCFIYMKQILEIKAPKVESLARNNTCLDQKSYAGVFPLTLGQSCDELSESKKVRKDKYGRIEISQMVGSLKEAHEEIRVLQSHNQQLEDRVKKLEQLINESKIILEAKNESSYRPEFVHTLKSFESGSGALRTDNITVRSSCLIS